MDELEIPEGVYTSTVGVYPGTSGETLDESIDPECPTYTEYFRTKWKAHFEVARPLMEDGLPLVIVQPGGVYGPHDKLYGSGRAVFRDYLTGDLPMIPRDWALPMDHAEDIAQAHIRAMDEGGPGEEYIVASESRTLPEVFGCAEEITGIPAPRVVPDAVFGELATIMRRIERITTPPEGFEAELLEFLAGRQFNVDNTKAKRDLGVEFRSLKDGLRGYLAWEIDQLDTDEQPDPNRLEKQLRTGQRDRLRGRSRQGFEDRRRERRLAVRTHRRIVGRRGTDIRPIAAVDGDARDHVSFGYRPRPSERRQKTRCPYGGIHNPTLEVRRIQ